LIKRLSQNLDHWSDKPVVARKDDLLVYLGCRASSDQEVALLNQLFSR